MAPSRGMEHELAASRCDPEWTSRISTLPPQQPSKVELTASTGSSSRLTAVTASHLRLQNASPHELRLGCKPGKQAIDVGVSDPWTPEQMAVKQQLRFKPKGVLRFFPVPSNSTYSSLTKPSSL